MSDVIGFVSYPKDGKTHYGCRGIGKRYDEFYKWVYSTSYKCHGTDWPWDYFSFEKPEDEVEFVKRYKDAIYLEE